MSPEDRVHMEEAITWAKDCKPCRPDIPMVGAIIAIGKKVIGRGRRGTGKEGDDDHAEMKAIAEVEDRSMLARATIYTTLEPCTPEVRSRPYHCCTELIRQAGANKVFIGILDPNQGVRGKGLWELQDRGIEVELFPPELAKEVRVLNNAFIVSQRQLGLEITSPLHGESLPTYKTQGAWAIKGKYVNPPGQDVFALVVGPSGHFAPQPHPLEQDGDGKNWKTTVYFGRTGQHTIYIVKANDLGVALVNYYRKVIRSNEDRMKKIRGMLKVTGDEEERFLRQLPGIYQAIEMNRLPKGLEVQDRIEVFIADKPLAPGVY